MPVSKTPQGSKKSKVEADEQRSKSSGVSLPHAVYKAARSRAFRREMSFSAHICDLIMKDLKLESAR
jgi:hypothetical protein